MSLWRALLNYHAERKLRGRVSGGTCRNEKASQRLKGVLELTSLASNYGGQRGRCHAVKKFGPPYYIGAPRTYSPHNKSKAKLKLDSV